MTKPVLGFIAPAALSLALFAAVPALGAGGGGGGGGGGGDPPDIVSGKPAQPTAGRSNTTTKSTHKSKKNKQSFLDDPAFSQGYRAAYATIYERNDYASAIAQLRALGHDDFANVANLIGYSYRKLGDYRLSKVWYESALKSDPTHVLTLQYYSLW